ncbi:Transposable element P transposase [Amphibalanus amphitrite]|uniref:Transposable element P transposase n=1 Tax=Amphibalanus amphitrite TaxID=1232801 RepID=A0A6A4WZJ5_AMPAM|nr:Transposable element P transposase [Amphibalanus amphitrite]
MSYCAVATCRSYRRTGKFCTKSFFRFPKDPATCATWVHRCSRQDPINVLQARICSDHFLDSDYDPSYLVKASLMPGVSPCLKTDAVPTQNLRSAGSSGPAQQSTRASRSDRRQMKSLAQDIINTEGASSSLSDRSRSISLDASNQMEWSPAATDLPAGEVQYLSPLEEVQKLSQQNRRLKLRMEKQKRQWRQERQMLLRKLRVAERKAHKLQKLLRLGVVTEKQVSTVQSGHRVQWTAEDISRALGLRCRSRKAYEYVQQVMHLPLPSAATLSRWIRGFRVTPGVIEAALAVLRAAVQGMGALERLCVVSFDEMALSSRYCYDASADQILQGSKLQLLMVRGLCAAWKQPLFYEIDSPMTNQKLNSVISVLESLGLRVTAVVSDMGGANEGMWRSSGICADRTWIINPVDDTRRVWVFADAPHLIKLMRVHTVADDGGLLIPDGRGGRALLGRGTFLELLELDRAELRVAHKLTNLHVQGTGQVSQRVRLATQLFSHTVGTAIKELLPRRQPQAEAVLTANAWFDVLNSRSQFDATIERSAYGRTAEIKAVQDRALDKMTSLISDTRKTSAKHPNGHRSMLPFQQGMLRTTVSLRGLYEELHRTVPELQFVLTSHLNQDCLENCFSQIRSLGGANTTPNAVEVRSRLKVLLMAPAPQVAASSGRAVLQLEPSDLMSTSRAPQQLPCVSNEALEGLLIQFEEPDQELAAREDNEAEGAYQAVAAPPSSSHEEVTPLQSESATAGDERLEREALAFVAGFVAAKCRHLDAGLGQTTDQAPPSSVPSSWVRALSRGRLTVPSPNWMTIVEEFEVIFRLMMGDTVDGQSGIVQRLLAALQVKRPSLDARIARKLVTTRVHLRIRSLNQRQDEVAAERRAAKQVRQHVRSGELHLFLFDLLDIFIAIIQSSSIVMVIKPL